MASPPPTSKASAEPGPESQKKPAWVPALAIAMILLGCCSNVFFLELIVREDPAAGNLITFAQFAFIALEGLIGHLDGFGLKKRAIAIQYYLLQVVVYFTLSVINNKAFDFHVSMPLHMVFRSASLLAQMLLGYCLLKKRYTRREYYAVFLVTIGITLATFASSKSDLKEDAVAEGEFIHQTWLIGVILLTVALVMSAGLGIIQEWTYKKFGVSTRENMFYSHLLSLPFFIFVLPDILVHVDIFSKSPSRIHVYGGWSLPTLWCYLLGNVSTQWVCSRGVFTLIGSTDALTTTLVITLRKFISLVLSIFYFGNPFTLQHWIGSILVFLGTYLYSLKPKQSEQSKRE